MNNNIYRITQPDGTIRIGGARMISHELNVSDNAVYDAVRDNRNIKGCTIENVKSFTNMTYRITGHGVTKTGMTAKQITEITGLKSNAVSVYAKASVPVRGWVIRKEEDGIKGSVQFVRSSAMYRCEECIYKHDDAACNRHQCQNPKGLYVLQK